jgi:uncharacterized membrane protein (DUF106 family)
MPDPSNPLEPSGFDLIAMLFPVLFGVVALAVLAGIVFTIYRLLRDRKKIAAYREAMLELPGEILKATREGDLAKAQLLQGQLALMQQQELLNRQRAFNAAAPSGVPGDINGDGVPGN